MTVQVRIEARIRQAALNQALARSTEDGIRRAADRVRDYAKAEITSAGRVGTGAMRSSVVSEVTGKGISVTGRVIAKQPYSRYQHDGTAGNGTGYIYPRRAKMLRFRGRSGAWVFAKRVRGVRGIQFLTKALSRLKASDFAP